MNLEEIRGKKRHQPVQKRSQIWKPSHQVRDRKWSTKQGQESTEYYQDPAMSVIPKDFGKAARWTTPGLSAELQEQVAERMEKHVAKLEEKGVINQDNITRVVVCKQVARLLHNTGISPTEAAWAWVAEQKTLGRFENRPIYRRVQGPVEIQEPGWENAAQLRVDWNGSRESGCTQEQLNQLQKTVRVERALRQHTGMVGRSWGNAESSSESEEEDEPTGIGRTEMEVEVDPESVEMAWQTTKGHFKGEGGKAQFWVCMGILLLTTFWNRWIDEKLAAGLFAAMELPRCPSAQPRHQFISSFRRSLRRPPLLACRGASEHHPCEGTQTPNHPHEALGRNVDGDFQGCSPINRFGVH